MVAIYSEAHAVTGHGEVEVGLLDGEVAQVPVRTSEGCSRVGNLERAKRQLPELPLPARELHDLAQLEHGNGAHRVDPERLPERLLCAVCVAQLKQHGTVERVERRPVPVSYTH